MEFIIPTVTAFGGALLGYLLTYTNEKAKNRALKEDIAKITAEKESTAMEFKLQQDRRKHQYERKHEVYARYNNLLDRFDGDKNPLLDSAKLDLLLATMLNTMYVNRDNEGESMKAINVFGNDLNQMIREALDGLKEIAKQTNELKLVAPEEINTLVNTISKNYQSVERISSPLFEDTTKFFTQSTDFTPINKEIGRIHNETRVAKTKLIELMREDLAKI